MFRITAAMPLIIGHKRLPHRIASNDLADAKRFMVDDAWRGQELDGLSREDAWNRMARG